MRNILVCFAMMFAVMAAHAEPMWGKAEYGASAAEIAKLFPEGASVTPTEKQRLDSGAMLRFQIENVEILGKSFAASFYFLDDGLKQVVLRHKSQENAHSCELTAGAVQEALRAKYGPDIKSTRSGGLGVMRDASWTSGKTTISMTMFAYNTPSCSIFINYSSRLAEAGSKL